MKGENAFVLKQQHRVHSRDRPEPNFLEECATKLLCLSLLCFGERKKGARVSAREESSKKPEWSESSVFGLESVSHTHILESNVIPWLEGGGRHAHEPLGDLMAGCMYIYGRI